MYRKNSMSKVWYYTQFEAFTGDLGMYPLTDKRDLVYMSSLVFPSF